MARKNNVARGAVASVAGGLLAFAGLAVPAFAAETNPIEPTAGEKQINLIGYNDFHGRLSNIEAMAAGMLCTTDKFGDANTLFVGNGDQAGASEFESSLLKDEPTLEALQELGTNTSFTSGNHEFDGGQEDALRIRQSLGGTLLAANVTKADGSLLLDAYKIFDVNGVKVAVVGAVTTSTVSGVSPDGIVGLTFGDPVAAVNKYADQLASSGEADVIIASYHEGGPTSGTLDENSANAEFSHIANDTTANVDVIYNAHTHMEYNYTVKGRPVVQSLSYGTAFSQIVLTLNADNTVKSAEAVVLDSKTTECASSLSPESQTRLDAIKQIKADAYAEAGVIGAQKIGVINDDITRAYTWAEGATKGDDRAQASSLGVLVADSMYEWANSNTAIGADASIMNPGGLRADLIGDGELTYKDAQTVLPFTNTLGIVTLTGEQFKQVLEEQWQRDADGNVPSRAYLQLGVSSNVSYTTDSTRAEGDRVTSVTINGEPLDFTAEYKLVMPSFLAAGGDNFHTLADGTMVDTGSIDLDAFVQYVKSLPNQELTVPTARPGVDTEGYFDAYGDGPTLTSNSEPFTFKVKDFNLRSKEFVANETIDVKIGDQVVGSAVISGDTANGDVVSADVTIDSIPAGISGEQTLTLSFQNSGTVAELPLTVAAITVVPESASSSDSASGFQIVGAGFTGREDVTITVVGPDGAEETFTTVTDDEGNFVEEITWATFDPETGEVIAENQPFPTGDYTVTAVQADLVSTATFTVTADEATPIPTTDDSTPATEAPATVVPAADNKGGEQLAATGADSGLLIGGLTVALLVAAAGATLVARRDA